MFEIEITANFRKRYKKLVSKNSDVKNKVAKAIEILRKDPRYPSLKTHKVYISEYGDVFSSFVTGDIRIIWTKIKDEVILLLLDIGKHSGRHSVYD